MRTATRTRLALMGALLVIPWSAACANDTTTSASAAAAPKAERDAGSAAAPAAGSAAAWEKVLATPNCECSDGSGYHYWIHRADPEKVLFYLEGGGACFSAATCG